MYKRYRIVINGEYEVAVEDLGPRRQIMLKLHPWRHRLRQSSRGPAASAN